MTSIEKIAQVDVPSLHIIKYPDPRLKEVCTPLEKVDPAALRPLIDKMFELMYAAKGVGLAANQVGLTVRLFVASPSFEQDDRRVYINPRILSVDGWEEHEEGCLSLPGANGKIKRHSTVTIEATDLDGNAFQETGTDLLARIFQHESDHLNGQLIMDKMGSVAKLANRRIFKDLEEGYDGR